MPKTPQTKRRGILSFTKEQELKIYREKYIKQGKIKLAKMYHDEFGETISSWQFQKVIEKYKLYYDKIKARRIKIKKDRNRGAKKIRINQINPSDYILKRQAILLLL